MIQKAQIGRGFRGVLNYVFAESAERGHEPARIVDGTWQGGPARAGGGVRRASPTLIPT